MIKERILQMKIEGYHNTEVANVEDILQHGFIYKENDKHWLGREFISSLILTRPL